MANALKKNWKDQKKKAAVSILNFNEHKQMQNKIKEERKKERSKIEEIKQKKRAYNTKLKALRIAKEEGLKK